MYQRSSYQRPDSSYSIFTPPVPIPRSLSPTASMFLNRDGMSTGGLMPMPDINQDLPVHSSWTPVSTIVQTEDYKLGTYSAAPHTSDETFFNMQKYIKELEHCNKTLEAKYNTLEAKYNTLEAKHNTIMFAYNGLLHRISPPQESEHSTGSKKRQDYPNIKFWFKHEWTTFLNECGTGVEAPHGKIKGVNVTMRFVELTNGDTIDGNRAADIRRHARSIWVYMAKTGTPPATWGSADLKTKEFYCREMRNRFEELSFCDVDWKAEQIATDNYPSWRATWTKQQEKNETAKSLVQGSDGNTHVKRSRCDSTEFGLKRKRVEGMQDSSRSEVGSDTKGNQAGTLVPSTSVSSEGNPEPSHSSTQELTVTLGQDSAQDVTTGDSGPAKLEATLTETQDETSLTGGKYKTSGSAVLPVPSDPTGRSPESFSMSSAVSTASPLDSSSMVIQSGPDPTLPLPSGTRATISNVPTGPAAPAKKSSKMRPGTSNTPRNLCSIDWCAKNPGGTTAEFKQYFDNLPLLELKKYQDLAEKQKAAGRGA